MTVATSTNRADFNGNGSTTVFPFTFRIFAATDLVVVQADEDGIETVLELGTDYTVSGVGSYNGGNVTVMTAVPDGEKLTIARELPITQGTDLRNQGAFFAETHEDVFDRLVMIGQQLQEQIDRCAKLPITREEDGAALIADIVLLADNLTVLTTLVANLDDITTVADDLNEVVSEIETVANAIANVNTVGNAIAAVNTVATAISNVNTVATNIANVGTVAGISSNVTTVAGISANVTSVAGNSSNINAVAGNATNINAVAGNNTNITAVAGNATNINAVNSNKTNIDTVAGQISPTNNVQTVAGIAANVTTVAGISANVTSVAGNSSNINAVAGNATNINAVAGNATNINAVNANKTNIDTVAGVNANVTTVAGISSAVSTVATNNANVSTVATNISSVNTVAGDIAAIITTANDLNEAVSEIEVVANNIAAVDAVGDDIANVNIVAGIATEIGIAATNVADINNFADVYQGASSTAPTQRNDTSALQVGDLYFNTSDDQMKVYGGAGWQSVGSTVNGTSQRYRYIATAAQTTFTGVDSNTNTLAYDVGFIDVYLNGVRLDQTDYTATSGDSVVLASGAALNDEVNIVAYGNFELADHYNKTDSDSRYFNVAGDTITGDLRGAKSASDALDLVGGASGTGNRIQIRGSAHPSTPNIMTFDTNSGEAMRIDSSGNVGIGCTPTQRLQIAQAVAVEYDMFVGTTRTLTLYADATQTIIANPTAVDMIFRTNDTERMRITSGGKFVMASTANGSPGFIQAGITNNTGSLNGVIAVAANSNGGYPIACRAEDTSQGLLGFFNQANTLIGSITRSGSNVVYNTSSDYRLKENIAPMTGALATITQLKPCTYTWKEDGTAGQGFIAHELAEVCPDAVTGEKDAVEADGSIKPQGVDTSFLVATLTAAIQELKAINDAQASRIETLEAKVAALEGGQ